MKQLLTAFILFVFTGTQAQTLFTYGKNNVSKEEFLRAFNKNNTSNNHSEKACREYLDLYTRFKLKVQAAYDAKLDTLATQKAEMQNFRGQIAESFMNDESSIQALVDEAFKRSQKDLRISHIYIPFVGTDTAAAYKKVTDAYAKLQSGADFISVAETYSQDPSVHNNKGDLGYITVFILPYELETLAYNTALGKYSTPFRSKTAYHIFKITAERPAAGRMRAAQILLGFPPGADNAEKARLKTLADSIYHALQNGASFKELATKYSNDNITYQAGGLMPEFGVGKFDGDYENTVFALQKDGDITPPFMSNYGYHIVQRIERIPVSSTRESTAMDALKQKVQSDNRIQVSKQALANKVMRMAGYKKGAYNEKLLWIYADSAWTDSKLPQAPTLNDNTVLFSYPKQKVTAIDFVKYLQSIKNVPSMSRGRMMTQLLQQYVETVAIEYYRNHLEEYNKEFATQLKEFKDGNLLFEVMQRQVWDKAAADSSGLRNFYKANKNKYWWESSADVILFTCSDSISAAKSRMAFEQKKSDWRTIVQNADGTVQADSGRFELAQLPIPTGTKIEAGLLTTPVKTSADNITSYVYIINVYNEKTPRNFEDAKGFVINDYQALLENKWIDTLKKKYPVKINEAVLQSCWK